MNEEIAKAVIGQMNSQIDLLFTIATAFCGGIVALTVQIVFHNADEDKAAVAVASWPLLIITFAVEGLSILFGYMSRACLTAVTPGIFNTDSLSELSNWTDAEFAGHGNLRVVMAMQFLFFMAGVAILLVVLVRNRHIVGGTQK